MTFHYHSSFTVEADGSSSRYPVVNAYFKIEIDEDLLEKMANYLHSIHKNWKKVGELAGTSRGGLDVAVRSRTRLLKTQSRKDLWFSNMKEHIPEREIEKWTGLDKFIDWADADKNFGGVGYDRMVKGTAFPAFTLKETEGTMKSGIVFGFKKGGTKEYSWKKDHKGEPTTGKGGIGE